MKQEDKYIDYLFESVRKEEPQLSFEEVAEILSTSTPPTLLGLAKGWFFKNINLNSLLFLSAVTLGFIAIFFFSGSNNSSQNGFDRNQIVTNPIQVLPSSKEINFEGGSDLSKISSSKIIISEATKNIKSSLNSKINNQKNNTITFQKFEKILISESPIIHPITPKFKLKKPLKLALTPSQNVIKKEKTPLGYLPKYKTLEEHISPWVDGSSSEIPWKIKRQTKIPILNETERVIQQFMDTKYLDQIFEKKENGYFKSLIMLVNYSFNENYFVRFNGQKVRLLNEKIAPDFDPNEPYIDVKRFKIKKSKAYFTFTYKDHHVQMQLRRIGEGWKRHKLKVKHKKEVTVNMTF